MKIDVADLTVGENIGAGGFGSVFRGSWKGWNGEVAMKRIECNGDAEKEVFSFDLECLYKLCHFLIGWNSF